VLDDGYASHSLHFVLDIRYQFFNRFIFCSFFQKTVGIVITGDSVYGDNELSTRLPDA